MATKIKKPIPLTTLDPDPPFERTLELEDKARRSFAHIMGWDGQQTRLIRCNPHGDLQAGPVSLDGLRSTSMMGLAINAWFPLSESYNLWFLQFEITDFSMAWVDFSLDGINYVARTLLPTNCAVNITPGGTNVIKYFGNAWLGCEASWIRFGHPPAVGGAWGFGYKTI